MKTILVVDDNSSNLQMVKNILQTDYQVSLVNNGERALQYLAVKKPDIILMDIMMPGLDGFETMQKIKSTDGINSIPIIMLTAMAREDTEEDCRRLGAQGLIAKPFLPSKMLDTVREILEAAERE